MGNGRSAVGCLTTMTKPASLDPNPRTKRNRAMSRFQVVEAPTKPRVVPTHRTIGCKIWILLLVIGGTALMTYGAAYEKQWEYKKLYISVGVLMYMCVALFFSFVIFDRKELQDYMLYMLYPWMCLSCLLLAALIFAMAEKFISVYYFVTMLIPILAIGFYTFGEIFLYLERQRLRPILLRERLQERVPLRVLQFEYDDGEFINWTSNVIHDDREMHNAKVTGGCSTLRTATANLAVAPTPPCKPVNNCFFHTAVIHPPPTNFGDDDLSFEMDPYDAPANVMPDCQSVLIPTKSCDSLALSSRCTTTHAFASPETLALPSSADFYGSASTLGAASLSDITALPDSAGTSGIPGKSLQLETHSASGKLGGLRLNLVILRKACLLHLHFS